MLASDCDDLAGEPVQFEAVARVKVIRDPWSHGMPRDGAIVFGDLGKLRMLRVMCTKCDREGRYSVRRLIEDHGRDVHVIDWLAMVTANCTRKNSGYMADQCEACCSTLICRA